MSEERPTRVPSSRVVVVDRAERLGGVREDCRKYWVQGASGRASVLRIRECTGYVRLGYLMGDAVAEMRDGRLYGADECRAWYGVSRVSSSAESKPLPRLFIAGLLTRSIGWRGWRSRDNCQ